MVTSFCDLPVELVVAILSFLPFQDVLNARLWSSLYKDAVDSSPVLLYDLELREAGMSDELVTQAATGGTRYELGQKLELLRRRRESWASPDIDLSRRLRVPFQHNPSHIYDLSGGAYLLGDCKTNVESRATLTVRYLDLCSADEGMSKWDALKKRKNESWPELLFEGRVADIGLALEEHDLIAAVTLIQANGAIGNALQPRPTVLLELQQFSTGKPHPLAQKPIIDITHDTYPRVVPPWIKLSVMIEIVGPRAVVSLSWRSPFWLGTDHDTDHYLVINWWTGTIHTVETIYEHTWDGFVFLDQDTILRTNTRAGNLEVAKLPSVLENENSNDRIETLAILQLPTLQESCTFLSIHCRADPNPYGVPHPSLAHLPPGSGGWRSSHNRPFYPDPDDAIIIFRPIVRKEGVNTWLRYWFVVHRKSVLRLVTHPPTGLTVLRTPLYAWEEWGPGRTRWTDNNDDDSSWITTTCGQRAVFMRWGRLVLRDFNPRAVRRAEAASGNGNAKEGGDTVRNSEDVLQHWDVAFTKEIRHGLPFVESESVEEVEYAGILLNDDYLLGLVHGGDDMTIKAVDVIDVKGY